MKKWILVACIFLLTACQTGKIVKETEMNTDIIALKNTQISPTWSAENTVLNDIAQSTTLASVTGEWYGSDIIYTYGVGITLIDGCYATTGDGSSYTITCADTVYKVDKNNPLNLVNMGEPWYGKSKRVGSFIYSITPTK